jgi:sec-independent protein translocase protein TatA
MFDIGGGELFLILVAVLIFFGPKKLPELAQSLGRGIREFKKAQREFTEHINSAFEEEQRKQSKMGSVGPSNTVSRGTLISEPTPPHVSPEPPVSTTDVPPPAEPDAMAPPTE